MNMFLEQWKSTASLAKVGQFMDISTNYKCKNVNNKIKYKKTCFGYS